MSANPSNFLFYDWGNFEPGGLREHLVRTAIDHAKRRIEIVQAYRIEDEQRQLTNVRKFTAEIDRITLDLDLPQTDAARAQLKQDLALSTRKRNLAQAWLKRSPQEREPAGRMPVSYMAQETLLTKEDRIRDRSQKLLRFLAKCERLPDAESARASWNRMADADYCNTLAHRQQVEQSGCRWNYDPEHYTSYQPTNAELFEIRLRHALMAQAIPVYAATKWQSSLEIVHARLFDRLALSDYDLLAQYGLRLARTFDFHVEWAGAKHPTQWEVEDETA